LISYILTDRNVCRCRQHWRQMCVVSLDRPLELDCSGRNVKLRGSYTSGLVNLKPLTGSLESGRSRLAARPWGERVRAFLF
jgi:hypothetical protein